MCTRPLAGARSRAYILPAILIALAAAAHAFYLPGVAPVDYEEGAPLDVFANKLSSASNHLPYDYYSLPFCRPVGLETKKKVKSVRRLKLGQILSGERMKPTKYEISMRLDEDCKFLCQAEWSAKHVETAIKRVADEYRVRLNLDNLPAIERFGQNTAEFREGFPLGFVRNGRAYINNHLHMTVLVHKPTFSSVDLYQPEAAGDLFRVVGFEVKASSSAKAAERADKKGFATACPALDVPPTDPFDIGPLAGEPAAKTIAFTYSVNFQESDVRWATRWDPLLKAPADARKIQWFSIINSTLVSAAMTALVAMILFRTVSLDFVRYNNLEDKDDLHDDSGWKVVHRDVFRPPQNLGLLAVLYGTGAHVLAVMLLTLAFALAGLLSPANRGGLLSALLFMWILSSVVNGYVSASFYAGMGGTQKRTITLGSAFFFSATVFLIFFALNLLLWAQRSSGGVPFFTLLILFAMWFGLSVPLSVLGAFLGYKTDEYKFPVSTGQIPREIPQEHTFTLNLMTAAAGLLPFGIVFLELRFILQSIWQGAVFYMFGFLFIVFLLTVIASAEVAVVITYLSLVKENYQWWWKSFLSAASAGFYMYIYCVFYLYATAQAEIRVHYTASILFISYCFIVCLGFGLLCGTVGFFTSFWFVKKIYASIRVD